MIKNDNLIKIEDMKQFNSDDLETLLHKLLNYLKNITSSDAGTIYLKDDNNNLRFNIFQNDTFSYETIFKLQEPLKAIKFPIEENTNTIAIESYLRSKIITVDDIYKESEFNFLSSKEFDNRFSYKTKSILSAPLINFYTNETIGVLQLINKKDKDGNNTIFRDEDKEFISLAGYLVTLSIISTQNSIIQLKKANEELERKVIQRTKKLEETQKELIEQANRDPMTKLYNRRYFNEVIKQLIQISQREETSLSIMIIDIDNFKNINDSYGHQIGDDVINNLADIFRNTVRTSDISIRFGGEEFIIVLPNTNIENGLIISEKVRTSVEESTTEVENNIKIKFTISIGLSLINQDDKNIENALRKADKALYKSKQNGKNQVNFLV